jgi:hypothetical protein
MRFDCIDNELPEHATTEWYIVDLINNRDTARTEEEELEEKLRNLLADPTKNVSNDNLWATAKKYGTCPF